MREMTIDMMAAKARLMNRNQEALKRLHREDDDMDDLLNAIRPDMDRRHAEALKRYATRKAEKRRRKLLNSGIIPIWGGVRD